MGKKEEQIFSRNDNEAMEKVITGIRKLDKKDSKPAQISEILEEIIEIFARIRRKVAIHSGEDFSTTLGIIIPEIPGNPEIILTQREENRHMIIRLLRKTPPTTTMILSPEGYRLTTLEQLAKEERMEEERLSAPKNPKKPDPLPAPRRIAIYSELSRTTLEPFLHTFRNRLKNAAKL